MANSHTRSATAVAGATAARGPRERSRAHLSVLIGALLCAVFVHAPSAVAQEVTRVVGRVLDAGSGRGLVGAQVRVDGTSLGTLSGSDGRYIMNGVPAGQIDLSVSYLGYADTTVEGLQATAGEALSLDLALTPAALTLQGVTVTVASDRGSLDRALEEQRAAVGVTSAVTAEQISGSPDGDAAAAIQRVSGVSVQDGKFVSVRGLGERYTTTSLNGGRLPSPEPERKTVPLDLFPAGLLQTITTSKTFSPHLSGDFSGAHVDIRTREFPARREVTYSYSAGFNPQVTGREITLAPASGGEWLALASDSRQIPSALRGVTSFDGVEQSDYNHIVRSFRNAWSVERRKAMPSTSMSASVGGNDSLLGRRIGYLASATYSIDQTARLGEVRAIALPGENGSTAEASRYEGSTGSTSVLWGGLLNLSTLFGPASRISLNGSYSRSAENDGRRERGIDENTGADLRIDRLRYVERGVVSGQLRGEHQLGQRHRFDWAVNASSVSRREPDRSEIVYLIEHDQAGREMPAAWALSGNEVAVRTFADLREDAGEISANYRLALGPLHRPLDLRLGGLARSTAREADNQAWSVQSLGSTPLSTDRSLREQAPEQIFGEAFTDPHDSVFSVAPLAQGGSYSARDRLFAGYAMVEWMATDRLQLVGGARLEHSRLELSAVSTLRQVYDATPTYTDVLPSVALNFALTPDQNLRFSASQTLARPEYREVAPIQFREVIGGENTRGNADLRRTLIRNFDLRWELYPAADEAFSVALFAKRFLHPIERIYLATSGTAINTFVNAAGAENYGIEIEARKGLGFIADGLAPFTAFANTTVMKSEIRLGSAGLGSTTNPDRPMLGQAPYVVNAGLAYASRDGRTSATLLYNVVGRRIIAAAGAPLPDVNEAAQPGLDLSLRFPIFGRLSGKMDARNLLDSEHRVEQGSVIREHYRSGRSFSAGVTIRP